MNIIELSYTEAVDVKVALEESIKQSLEVLKDETFKQKYPNCTRSLEDQVKRDEVLVKRIQAELDKL